MTSPEKSKKVFSNVSMFHRKNMKYLENLMKAK